MSLMNKFSDMCVRLHYSRNYFATKHPIRSLACYDYENLPKHKVTS